MLPYVEKVTDIEKLQLKNLYRKLVKKYHPDYAKNLTEREQREEMMKQVNQAYTEGDEKKLWRLYFDK